MRFAIELAERGLLPDSLIRSGVRELDEKDCGWKILVTSTSSVRLSKGSLTN